MTKKKEYPLEVQNKVKDLYENERLTLLEISKRLEITVYSIKRIIKETNIKKRTKQESMSKYYFNYNYFDIIDTEEKAYWLGFIYADGFINTDNDLVGITLSSKDENHLYKFKKAINSNHPINTFIVDKKYSSCRIAVINSNFKSQLIEKGVLLNKSLKLKFPKEDVVKNELIFHFLRGYFDGDGSIGYDSIRKRYVINLLGTKDFLIEVLNLYPFSSTYSVNSYLTKDTDIKYISMLSKKNVETFLDSLYKDSNIYLERKYLKYKKFKQSI